MMRSRSLPALLAFTLVIASCAGTARSLTQPPAATPAPPTSAGALSPSATALAPTEPTRPTQPTRLVVDAVEAAVYLPVGERDQASSADALEIGAQVAGNTAFALELYDELRAEPGNLLLSPYSITAALAMTYAGARGTTQAEMRRVLHFDAEPDRLHAVLGALELELAARSTEAVRLNVANQTFGARGARFEDDFLRTLTQHYGAPMATLDFATDPETARQAINEWAASQTEERITELFPAGSIDPTTALVLANAVYLHAKWKFPFDAGGTTDQPFELPDGVTVQVPTMHYNDSLPSATTAEYEAVELPYDGEALSMVVIEPQDMDRFERKLTPARLQQVLDTITPGGIHLSLPRFSFRNHHSLKGTLAAMGMPSAFGPGADFSGMTGAPNLWIQSAEHDAFIEVDEEGTEAAAATGMAMAGSHGPTVTIDRPFLFLIRENETGSILFLGRVTDPRSAPD